MAAVNPFEPGLGRKGMIELVLVFCLSDTPDRCTEKREAFTEYANPMQCTMSAQQHAQEYLAAHPRYMLAKWRCEVDKPHDRPI